MHGSHVSRRFVRPWAVIAALALVVMLVPIVPAAGAPVKAQPVSVMEEIWVDNSVAGPGTGTEADPFKLLTDGLAHAGDGSVVHVAEGSYGPYSGETLPFLVPSGVTIEGAFDSSEGWLTWLVGEWGNDSPIMVVAGADYVGLKDIGFAENMNVGALGSQNGVSYGAGLYAIDSYVEVDHCSFQWLIASGGSAIYAQTSDVVVSASVFDGSGMIPIDVETRDASKYEKRLEKYGADLLPDRSWGLGMQQPVGCLYGGAVLAYGSNLDISTSLFQNNVAEASGGAILNAYGTMTTRDCAFVENEAGFYMIGGATAAEDGPGVYALIGEGPPYGGGAVSTYESDYESSGDFFLWNYGDPGAAVLNTAGMASISRAGIYENEGGTLVALDYTVETDSSASFGEISGVEVPSDEIETGFDIDASDISDNIGPCQAYTSLRPARISNSLFANNEAWWETVYFEPGMGGSVVAPVEPAYKASSVEGCTFVDNWADSAVVVGDPFEYTALVNSIIWSEVSEEGAAATWSATQVDAWNNDIYGDLDARLDVDNISEDPLFTEPDEGNFRLLKGSPCIDTGTDAGPVESDILFDPRPWDLDYMSRPVDGNDDGAAAYDMGAYEARFSGRIGGANRYETAVGISQQYFGRADTVVLATGRAFADGLAGSGLAGFYGAPLLLTNGVTLMPIVANEIERLGASRVFVLGETNAISEGVEEALLDMGLEVVRIGGADRYETAALIAEHLFETGAMGEDTTAFIARGDLFPDALAAAPIAYYNHMPVLLVRPDALPEHTVDVWNEFGMTSAVVVGGQVAVNQSVVTALGVPEYERISGANRYETAANLAEWAWEYGYAGFWVSGVATGDDFADALSGGAGIGSQNGVLLLTPRTSVAPACENAVKNHAGEVSLLQTFGGPSAISQEVYDYLMELLD